MSAEALEQTVLDALAEVAPEVDPDAIQRDVPLRDQLDIDSMDFLNFVIAMNERTGIEIPESDYGELATLTGCLAYLARAGSS